MICIVSNFHSKVDHKLLQHFHGPMVGKSLLNFSVNYYYYFTSLDIMFGWLIRLEWESSMWVFEY
jgi:hypothetical protein